MNKSICTKIIYPDHTHVNFRDCMTIGTETQLFQLGMVSLILCVKMATVLIFNKTMSNRQKQNNKKTNLIVSMSFYMEATFFPICFKSIRYLTFSG